MRTYCKLPCKVVLAFGVTVGSYIALSIKYTSRNAADDLFDEASCNGYTFDDDGDTTRNSNNKGVNSSNNSRADLWFFSALLLVPLEPILSARAPFTRLSSP